jgi:hypothetical protein
MKRNAKEKEEEHALSQSRQLIVREFEKGKRRRRGRRRFAEIGAERGDRP